MEDQSLIERLRNFEGSDELGNGDFSLLREAAAALEAAREDAERWEFARNNWHRLATATKPDGNGGFVCDELLVMPAHEDDPPLIGLDAAIDQARGKAGREVEGG